MFSLKLILKGVITYTSVEKLQDQINICRKVKKWPLTTMIQEFK